MFGAENDSNAGNLQGDVQTGGAKSGVDGDSLRQKRAEHSVQIRRSKRDDQLRKRRAAAASSSASEESAPVASATTKFDIPSDLPHLPRMLEAIKSQDMEEKLAGTLALRKLLSKPTDPPVDAVIDAGFIPFLRDLLALDCNVPESTSTSLVFEAAWALTNIGSSDRTYSLVEEGCLPNLVKLLTVQSGSVREQAAWCIGNISGDGPSCRDLVLNTPGALQGLMLNLQQPENLSTLRNVTWSASNLCRKSGSQSAKLELVKPLIPMLVNVIVQHDDEETLADAAWALSYVSDGDDNERLDAIMEAGVCPIMVDLLRKGNSKFIHACIRTVGNMVTGTDKHTQAAIDAGILPELVKLVQNQKPAIRKEALWAASNITAGTQSQIGSFLAMPELPELTVQALASDEWAPRREAAWCISNICTGGAPEHIQCVALRLNALGPLVELLSCDDTKMICVSLDALRAILNVDQYKFGEPISECGGLEIIEELQNHSNQTVYEKAVRLVEDFFAFDDDEEDQTLAPEVSAEASAFQFNSSITPGFGQATMDGKSAAFNNEMQPQQFSTGFNFGSLA